ncbi:MBL fold metallo-hydrolase [Aestuariimicrobium ganziense]|uniref:MBL fold metallo-hydrolase n=1 Tax=Aestuariimicrobium ganziense TaxID=2773677 RepID=UPI0019434D50|nr:MBL fold metallo-hydrolase [Aestuariimicrobium ganziense]
MDLTPHLGPWQQLRDGVYRAVAEPATVNVGLVVGTDGVLLIDTGSTPAQGRAIAESAAELTGRPISHVIITHDHWDHYWGLSGVLEVCPDAVVIAHESVAPPLSDDARATMMAGHLGVDVSQVAVPNTPIALARGVNLGGLRVEAVHLGAAHTAGDLIVVVQEARVAFAGDLYETAGPPCFGPDSTVGNWPNALDGALAGAKEETLVVPGHGDPTGPMTAFQQRAEISMIFGAAERLVARGVRLDDALAALDQPVDESGQPVEAALEWEWPFDTDTIKDALPLAYAELKSKGMEPRRQLPLV